MNRRLFLKSRLWLAFIAFFLGLRLTYWLGGGRAFGPKPLTLTTPIPNGGSGAAFMGRTFGSIHLFGQDWTGVELVIMLPLLAFLIIELWELCASIAETYRTAPHIRRPR